MWQEQACWALCIKAMKTDSHLRKKETFLPNSEYPHPSITPHYRTPFCLRHLYIDRFIGISHQLLSSIQFMKFLTDTFSKIINHKLHKCIYVTEQLHLCRHTAWRRPHVGQNMYRLQHNTDFKTKTSVVLDSNSTSFITNSHLCM